MSRVFSHFSSGKVDDDYDELLKQFGNSKQFIESAGHALRGETGLLLNPSNSLDAAHQVAGSTNENGSSWGEKVGWMYGSALEDVLTGLMIHTRGWRSGYCNPDPSGFLGCAPSSLLATMIQQKTWSTGLLEILFSKNNLISATLTGNLQIRMCMAYLYVIIWGLRSIPELCYAVLPAYCIITNTNFLPKFQEPEIFILVAIFVIYNMYTLSEYIQIGFSIRSWWINQIKLLGLSKVAFEITPKDDNDDGNNDGNVGKVTFVESPFFVAGTTVLLVQLSALAMSLLGLQSPLGGGHGSGIVIDFNFPAYGITTASSRTTTEDRLSGMSLEEIKDLPCFDCRVNIASICVVCLDDVHRGDRCRRFPSCNHVFHAQCIDPWLVRRLTCPTCRSPFKTNVNLDVYLDAV
ncbi:hypothetical protein Ddye_016847 [Dipteronia dyeriana]|uniref:RING-type domain-containing protein n=1 Tax=Dipteronia dyeriana TaxID=168575 RepID=A0AAD9U881_9ROSI|nr:hypothetical protein Ddye_016847 [Dipteronia dyeriana]